MLYDENDIKFILLNDAQFEELCFELLHHLDYEGLSWRLGGADSGRDIEARKIIPNSLVGNYHEKWFFECKKYKNGVPPSELMSKVAWAEAENVDHLVFIVSSYLTTGARAWVEKIRETKKFRIHTLEGKRLKKLLLNFPNIINNFFLDPYQKLLIEIKKRWLIYNIIPQENEFELIVNQVDISSLDASDLIFMWVCYTKISKKFRNQALDSFFRSEELCSRLWNFCENSKEPIDFDKWEITHSQTGYWGPHAKPTNYTSCDVLVPISGGYVACTYVAISPSKDRLMEFILYKNSSFLIQADSLTGIKKVKARDRVINNKIWPTFGE